MTIDYVEKLHAAYEFTEQLGASFERLPEISGELFTDKYAERLHVAISNLGIDSFDGAIGQCMKWSHALRPHAEKVLGAPILLTFGQLVKQNRPAFNPSWTDLQNWYRNGFSASDFKGRTGINLHAW